MPKTFILDIDGYVQSWILESGPEALKIYETHFPNDRRPRAALEAIRMYLAKEIGFQELRERVGHAASATERAFLLGMKSEVYLAARSIYQAINHVERRL